MAILNLFTRSLLSPLPNYWPLYSYRLHHYLTFCMEKIYKIHLEQCQFNLTCFQSDLLTILSLSVHKPGLDINSWVCPCSLAPWLCSWPPEWWWWWCSGDELIFPAENTHNVHIEYMNNSLHLAQKYAHSRYLPVDMICSKRWTVLKEQSLKKTVSFEEQIKLCPRTTIWAYFKKQVEAIAFITFIILKYFLQDAGSFEN